MSDQESIAPLLDALEAFGQWLQSGAVSSGLEAWTDWDYTFSQLRMVMILGQSREPLAVNELSARVGLSIAAGGRSIEKLVRSGVVQRIEDEHDRRIKRVSLSAQGRAKLRDLDTIKRHYAAEMLARLEAADRDQLLTALTAILASISPHPEIPGGNSP